MTKTELNYENVSPYMLWYTDNSANFTYDIRANNLAGAYQKRYYFRLWLTDDEKSDIASRKVIYFEKNKNGRVDKIIVPDIPSDEGKLSLMNYEGSYGMIYRNENNIALDYVKPGTLKISPHAVVYQALALDYTDSSSKTSDGRFNALSPYFYETHNYEVNYSQCFVWEYDYKRNTMEKLSGSSLEVGDTIIIRGNEYSPREIIVLKNNDNIPTLEDCEMYESMHNK